MVSVRSRRYRVDAAPFFANASRLRDDILAAGAEADPPIRMVLIDAEAMPDIDSSGAQVLSELLDTLDDLDIRLALARVRKELRDELQGSRIEERIGTDGIYLEIDDGVRAFDGSDGPYGRRPAWSRVDRHRHQEGSHEWYREQRPGRPAVRRELADRRDS